MEQLGEQLRQYLRQQQHECHEANLTDSAPVRHSITQELPQLPSALPPAVWLKNDYGYCPRVFDGISCWQPSAPGQLATQPCPEYFAGFFHHNLMSKQCTELGQWFYSEEHDQVWTNYSLCGRAPIIHTHANLMNYSTNHLMQVWTPVIKRISRTGYGISLSALLVAMVIFCCVRKLRSYPRNNLHMHLFMSFILKAVMWVGMDLVPQQLLAPSSHGSWLCKSVTVVWQYCTLANYSWVTMEGLYLFCLVHLAMFTDHSRITAYIIIGWGFPVCFILIWGTLRAIREDLYCWRVHLNEEIFWIIRAPTVILILVNAVLFVSIVVILRQKLTAAVSPETRRYRRLARSTLVLMPLFGVHYVLLVGLSAYINVHRVVELVWLFWDQLFASFQGFSVAVLYCFLNSEVKQELKKIFSNWYEQRVRLPRESDKRTANSNRRTAPRSSVMSSILLDKTSVNSLTPSPKARSSLAVHNEEPGEEQDRLVNDGATAGDEKKDQVLSGNTTVQFQGGNSESVRFTGA